MKQCADKEMTLTLSLFKWGTTSASENYALNVVVSSMFHYIISDMVF
jgi:hypothetical protein